MLFYAEATAADWFSVGFAAIAIVVSIISLKKSNKGIEVATESNSIAKVSNKIAEEGKEIAKKSVADAHNLVKNHDEKYAVIELFSKTVEHACRCKDFMLDQYNYQEQSIRLSEQLKREIDASANKSETAETHIKYGRVESLRVIESRRLEAFSKMRETHALLNADKATLGALMKDKANQCQQAIDSLIEYSQYGDGEPLFRKVEYVAYRDHIHDCITTITLKFRALFEELETKKWNS